MIINIFYRGNIVDLHQLQAFEQIVLQGSFSKAARKLGLSQPTVSLRVQALEQMVGGPLFIRGGSRLSLTEQGRSFLPYAQAALRAMTTGIEVAQHTAQGKRGRVVVATLPSLSTGFFASTLARLYQTHPQLDILVHTGHTQQVAEMLSDGFAHIGFVSAPFFHPDMTPLLHLQEPLLLVVHANHPLAVQEQVKTSDLEELGNPFFFIDWSLEMRQWQKQHMVKNRTLVEVPPHTARDLLLQGRGAAFLTRSFIHDDLKNGNLKEIPVVDLPLLRRESVLIRHHRVDALPAAVDAFLDLFREEAWGYVENEKSARSSQY
jgi:DNA-binding transcriptional LysR family regulator